MYHLSDFLLELHSGFNVLQYITLRTVFAAITALLISTIAGPSVIRYLSHLKIGETIRKVGPRSHYKKQGTPTMGGVLIIGTITFSTLLWADILNYYVIIALATMLAFGVWEA